MIILPGWLIIDGLQAPRRNWGVRIEAERIADIAPVGELKSKYPLDEVLEAGESVLSPGFVNTHTHLYGVLAHGIPLENAPEGFWPFLEDFWWPRVEDRLDHAMIRASAAWQCAQMIHSGVTSFYDCLEAPASLPGCLDVVADAVRPFGQRAILSFEATERVSPENGQAGLRENTEFIRSCRKAGGVVSGMMCFHTTFTCTAPFIRQAFEMAQELGTSVHMHLSEGPYEPAQVLKNYGLRPLEYYDSLGVAGPTMLASQCVHLSLEEISLAARRGVRIAHMPLSNCEVGGGIAPIPQIIAAGIQLGLGSDSYIDDFFSVMRGAFLIHKAAQQDPRVMPAGLVWHLATEAGARALGLEKIGRIEIGWQADLQLIHPCTPTPIETWNLYDQLVLYCSRFDVEAAWVAGRPLLLKRELPGMDEQALRCHVGEQARRLWQI